MDPLDKEIMIDGRRFRVIGVVEQKGKFLFFNRDNIILVPLGAMQKRDPVFNFLRGRREGRCRPARSKRPIEQTRETLRR